MLHLRHGGDAVDRHVLVYAGPERLAGYAHLDVTDEVAGSSAELVVDPGLRGQGSGRRLVRQLLAETPGRPAAAVVARRQPGRRRAGRARWASRSPARCGRCAGRCTPRCPHPVLPDGVFVRTFRPGRGRRGLARAERTRLRRPPRAGPLDGRRPAPTGWPSRGSTRRLLPRRTATRTGSSASTGPRCTGAGRARPRADRRGVRGRRRPRRAGARPRPGADPGRAAAPARAAAWPRRDAVRRRGQRRRRSGCTATSASPAGTST